MEIIAYAQPGLWEEIRLRSVYPPIRNYAA